MRNSLKLLPPASDKEINMNRPLVPPGSGNFRVYTPDALAQDIVDHFADQFKANDSFLDPCRGGGAFTRAIKRASGITPDWCEIDQGRDFLSDQWPQNNHYDWIITNPPYGRPILLKFLKRSFSLADNVIFLMQAAMPEWTAKQRAADAAGFDVCETYRVAAPNYGAQRN